jgi:hypothetical protein
LVHRKLSFGTTTAEEKMTELSEVAKMLLTMLKLSREKNLITPERPITAKAIVERYLKKFPNANISDANVREWINELASASYPVCSNKHGYWYGTRKEELEETLAHRRSRVQKQLTAIKGLEIALERLNGEQLFNDHPVMRTLTQQFDLAEIYLVKDERLSPVISLKECTSNNPQSYINDDNNWK